MIRCFQLCQDAPYVQVFKVLTWCSGTAELSPIHAAAPEEAILKDQEPDIRVLIADDHSLFRDGVARLLAREHDITVVGQANDGREAIELARQYAPDVILMDISMPGINGIEATRVIHREHPQIRIIGLSMYEDQERAQAMRAAGATDYKTKGCGASELNAAIRACPHRQEPLREKVFTEIN